MRVNASLQQRNLSLRGDGDPLLRGLVALALAIFFPIAGLPVSLLVAKQDRESMRPNVLAELAVRISAFLVIGGAALIAVLYFQAVVAPTL